MIIKGEQGGGNVSADIGSPDAATVRLTAQLAKRMARIIGRRANTERAHRSASRSSD